MQQTNSQEIRINNMQTDLKQLQTNTNLYMLQSKDEIKEINQQLRQLSHVSSTNTQNLDYLQQSLNARVEEIFIAHEASLIKKIKDIEQEKNKKLEEEIKRREEMSAKFTQMDELVEKLDKKFEQKANDKFIVSTIQNNLINNQILQQTLVEKSIRLIDDLLKLKLEEMQKWVDDKIQQQYYQIQNFQTYLRKSERVVEELQSSITLTKNSTIEFEKQFTSQINDISQKNQIFKETVALQTKSIVNQGTQMKQQFDQLQQQIKIDFDKVAQKQEQDLYITQNKIDSMNNYIQFCVNSSEQKVSMQILKENQELSEKLTSNYSNQINPIIERIGLIEQDIKNQVENCNQNKEKFEKFLKNSQVHQRLYQKKEGMPIINHKQNIKDQLGVIDSLFKYISQIYSQIHKSMAVPENEVQFQTLQPSARHSQSCSQVIMGDDNQGSTKKLTVSPTRSPIRQNGSKEKNQTTIPDKTTIELTKNQTESMRIHDRSGYVSQDKATKPERQDSEEIFSDQKIYEQVRYPLLVVGKTQILDTRPSQDLFTLQQKVKKVQNILGGDMLSSKQYYNLSSVQRCNSASKRLPKINSRNLNFSID